MNYDRSRFQVVDWTDLPELPWLPNCALAKDLAPTADETGAATAAARWRAQVGGLTREPFGGYPYHGVDWRLVCTVASAVLDDPAPLDDGLIETMAWQMECNREQGASVQQLFAHPVIYSAVNGRYSDGPRRACALREAQVPNCVVVVLGP